MIRFLFSLLGFLILAAGFVALVVDGTRAIASGGAWEFTKTETTWSAFSPQSLASARDLVGSAGEGALNWALAQPTAAVLAVLGVLLMLLGRRRRRPIGVAP